MKLNSNPVGNSDEQTYCSSKIIIYKETRGPSTEA